jgi:CDP-glucose 4,6-dehydratase
MKPGANATVAGRLEEGRQVDSSQFWAGRTVLITGAAGLLGGSVARRLTRARSTVIGLDRDWGGLRGAVATPGLLRVDGDIRSGQLVAELLATHGVDTVIHLAAQTLVGPALVDPVDTFENNIEGSWQVLEACRRASGVTSVVVASSDKAYGDWAGRVYREDMALRAHHPYDASKAATDLLTRSYAMTFGVPATITRCGNLYGGGDLNWSRIVPGTIRSILENSPPVIRSDGTLVRDYLHVDDAAAAVLTLAMATATHPELAGEAFNFAAGSRVSVLEIVRRILELMSSELEPIVEGRALQEIPEQRLSTAKARRILAWRPVVSLDAGLREAIGWYRDHLPAVAG